MNLVFQLKSQSFYKPYVRTFLLLLAVLLDALDDLVLALHGRREQREQPALRPVEGLDALWVVWLNVCVCFDPAVGEYVSVRACVSQPASQPVGRSVKSVSQ